MDIHQLLKILGGLLITLSVSLAEKKVYDKVRHRLKRGKGIWESALVRALHGPLQVFIWLYGLSLAIDWATPFFQWNKIAHLIAPARRTVGILLAFWFFSRFVKKLEPIYAVGRLLRFGLAIFASIFLLQSLFDLPLSGVLAFAGGSSITIGFAAKELLANIFGGLLLFIDRPFVIGDWISIPEKKLEGVVEEIGWRLTCLKTFDKRPVYIPNALFLTALVENPSRMTHRRLIHTVGVRYEDGDKLQSLLDTLRMMLAEHPDIDAKEPFYVHFVNFAPSSLEISIIAHTKKTDRASFLAVQEDLLFKIREYVRRAGAEIAYPTTTVHLEENKL